MLCAFGSASESLTQGAAVEVDLRKVALATVRLYRVCRLDTLFCIALLERELEKAGCALFQISFPVIFLIFQKGQHTEVVVLVDFTSTFFRFRFVLLMKKEMLCVFRA